MTLSRIAEQIGQALENADKATGARKAAIVENDARSMAHHIVAYVLERATPGTPSEDLGRVMIEGAFVGEGETETESGTLADPVIAFLDGALRGAKAALAERYGADAPTQDPVEHAIQYHLTHGIWPANVSADVVSKAKAAMGKTSGPPRGTFI